MAAPGTPPEPYDDKDAYISPFLVKRARFERRRERIVQEIMANRRGEYTVPTWVLTAVLAAIVVGVGLVLVLL